MSQQRPAGGAAGSRFAGFETLPIRVTVRVGRARCTVGGLADLDPGAVITLDRRVGEPFEMCAGGVVLGLVEAVADRDGVALKLVAIPGDDDDV